MHPWGAHADEPQRRAGTAEHAVYDAYISRALMVRTQIYLSTEDRQGLQSLARQLGRSQSDLIREAIDGFL